jgi:predicted nucleotidyltransferase component of viral defense system
MTPGPPQKMGHKNIGASVRALLLNIAREQKRDYNALLVQFAQERFLYRLSISSFSSHFVLKGALLLRAYPLPLQRPTKDIDLLGRNITNELPGITAILRSVQKMPCDDGVDFLPQETTIVKITEQAEYVGARAKVQCLIGGAHIMVQIDIGFGDAIVPGPVEMEYPVLLGFPSPHIQVYSLESSIAEKLQSLARLGLLTSRMKDLYDVIFIAQQQRFRRQALHHAMVATFAARGTSFDALRRILGETFSSNREKQKLWSAFLRLQTAGVQQGLPQAIDHIREFIEPALEAHTADLLWNPVAWKWE